MTDEQATAELKYRLAKYIILTLRDKGMVTQQVAELAMAFFAPFLLGRTARKCCTG